MARGKNIWDGRPMMGRALIVLILGAVGCRPAAGPTEEQIVSPEMIESHQAEVQSWHDQRLASLREEDGWLTLVGLTWLQDGDNAVGSDPSSAVPLPGSVADHLGTIRLARTEAGVETSLILAEGHRAEVAGAPVDDSAPVPLVSDAEPEPTVVHVGTVSFYVIDRNGRIGVRAKDSASPVRAKFQGIDRFPASWDWRIETEYTPRKEPLSVEVPTALGTVDTLASPGRIRFECDGRSFELDAFDTGNAGEVWLIFGDQTNGETTYGGGRFVYAAFDGGDTSRAGKLVVDFNRAYNPPCVFTPYATCPLPTPENRLALAVEAGERVFGAHH